jgi:hypothetical protein
MGEPTLLLNSILMGLIWSPVASLATLFAVVIIKAEAA